VKINKVSKERDTLIILQGFGVTDAPIWSRMFNYKQTRDGKNRGHVNEISDSSSWIQTDQPNIQQRGMKEELGIFRYNKLKDTKICNWNGWKLLNYCPTGRRTPGCSTKRLKNQFELEELKLELANRQILRR
jgi:hypothetical protein